MASLDPYRPVFQQAGQGHVFQFAAGLDVAQREAFARDLAEIEVGGLRGTLDRALAAEAEPKPKSIQPVEGVTKLRATPSDKVAAWWSAGLAAVAKGQAGAILMAGGQGSRLGFDGPKGMYDVGLPSKRTLYQLQAERINKLRHLAAAAAGVDVKTVHLPWYIMTSEGTRVPSERYLREHNFFGLPAEDVFFFEQGTLPCMFNDGRIVLEQRHRVAKAPNGNGGMYEALYKSGALADMARRGVTSLHVYGVDNVLVRPADPTFVGFCLEKGADAAAKVVPKDYPEEAVGVYCSVDGVVRVVEYSELPPAMATSKDASGELRFNAGNIANHYFTRAFLEKVSAPAFATKLPHHIARKKIPFIDANGTVVKPDSPNGVKLELFVFDVFCFASNMAILEVVRADEFAPVKNAPGSKQDTPESARALIGTLHCRWINDAGGKVVESSPGSVAEVAPSLSYGGEGLGAAVRGKTFTAPCELH